MAPEARTRVSHHKRREKESAIGDKEITLFVNKQPRISSEQQERAVRVTTSELGMETPLWQVCSIRENKGYRFCFVTTTRKELADFHSHQTDKQREREKINHRYRRELARHEQLGELLPFYRSRSFYASTLPLFVFQGRIFILSQVNLAMLSTELHPPACRLRLIKLMLFHQGIVESRAHWLRITIEPTLTFNEAPGLEFRLDSNLLARLCLHSRLLFQLITRDRSLTRLPLPGAASLVACLEIAIPSNSRIQFHLLSVIYHNCNSRLRAIA